MRDHPAPAVRAGHTAPVPRRIRAVLGGAVVLDTVRARYVWEWPHYPQYYVPRGDVRAALTGEGVPEETPVGPARRHDLHAGGVTRQGAALAFREDAPDALRGLVRLEWAALDAWFEEDEEVFVHPRDPYTRVDALRSTRHVRIELDGVLLAESSAPVLVFETGLPTRWYLPRTAVDRSRLVPSTTRTACPYKGRTSAWWSVDVGGRRYPDLAWSYDFPTRELLPIAGLIAFHDEEVDVVVDGERRLRPRTRSSR